MLSHLSDARVRLIPVDTNCKDPSWMSGTPNRFKNLTVWDELCVYGMCVFERMDMDVPVPQHVCGRPKSTLGVHVCLTPCLRHFYFDATYSRPSESPLIISLPPSTVLPQEYWNYRHVGSALVRQALYFWSHLLLMMSKHLPSIRLRPRLPEAALLEIR